MATAAGGSGYQSQRSGPHFQYTALPHCGKTRVSYGSSICPRERRRAGNERLTKTTTGRWGCGRARVRIGTMGFGLWRYVRRIKGRMFWTVLRRDRSWSNLTIGLWRAELNAGRTAFWHAGPAQSRQLWSEENKQRCWAATLVVRNRWSMVEGPMYERYEFSLYHTNVASITQSSHQNRRACLLRGSARDQKRRATAMVGRIIMAMSNARRELPLAWSEAPILTLWWRSRCCRSCSAL